MLMLMLMMMMMLHLFQPYQTDQLFDLVMGLQCFREKWSRLIQGSKQCETSYGRVT